VTSFQKLLKHLKFLYLFTTCELTGAVNKYTNLQEKFEDTQGVIRSHKSKKVFNYFFYICIAVGDPIIKRKMIGPQLTGFTYHVVVPVTSQVLDFHQYIYCGLLCVKCVEVRGSCLFCWYLWNCLYSNKFIYSYEKLLNYCWLFVNIIPIYKSKGNINDSNYIRPIIIVSCLGKVFTSVLAEWLNTYSGEFLVLHECQYIFNDENKDMQYRANSMSIVQNNPMFSYRIKLSLKKKSQEFVFVRSIYMK